MIAYEELSANLLDAIEDARCYSRGKKLLLIDGALRIVARGQLHIAEAIGDNATASELRALVEPA